MSNAIRYDSLLLRDLAAELAARLRGLVLARAEFDRADRTVVLSTGPRRRPLVLSWKLQPASGQLLLLEGVSPRAGALLQIPPGTSIARVEALPDERIVRLELLAGEAAPGRRSLVGARRLRAAAPGRSNTTAPGLVRVIVVELIGSRWNALALGADDVIVDTLVVHRTAAREQRPGVRYTPPAARPRLGLEGPPELAQWLAVLAPVPAGERMRVLLESFAHTSPINAGWILGDAGQPDAGVHLLAEAHLRYRQLVTSPPQPGLLNGYQPYGQPLAETGGRTASLLAAFSAAAAGAGTTVVAGEAALRELVLARLHEREQLLQTRQEKLQEEAAGAETDAARLRADADLLLARLQDVPRGSAEVELTDFAGQPRRLRLDPAWPAQRNAQHWYEQARRRARAVQRIPALLERAAREQQRLDAVRDRLQAGAADPAELQQWVRRAEESARTTVLPYRKYRSSGGLEVRVGRNARANDALTREHSAPEDIWLHARDAGGAHVLLRWGRRDENPPRADLLEAAALAALHSRARTSALVPVDWTRRKYVRKPRKAAPGQVVLERASTVFVAPDPALERRLRREANAE